MTDLKPCRHGRVPASLKWDVYERVDNFWWTLRFWPDPDTSTPCCHGTQDLVSDQATYFQGLADNGKREYVAFQWNGIPRE